MARTESSIHDGLLVIVAHQDDDLLFMNPDVMSHIREGHLTRTVFVTAGDAGLMGWDDGHLSLSAPGIFRYHWQLREDGIRAAYAAMADVVNVWTTSSTLLGVRRAVLTTLRDAPQVSLVFLRLPDGNVDGTGFARTDYASLERLWTGQLQTLRSITENELAASYAKDTLVDTLGAAMREPTVDQVWTLDATGVHGNDHSDVQVPAPCRPERTC